ncbi:site-2 protease family protein [Gemmobacter denitrificans]|uniref:Site-2 protease family protein n=1 Tax=Gemmobacter denitrificans TaxID=3123040 RepID=A0ABU8BWL1_9RHOB
MFQEGPILFSFRGIFGVPVQVSQSAALLIGIIAAVTLMRGGDPVNLVLTMGILVGSVYLHELGHAWGARVQGLRVDRIVLHGFGGFCQHQRSSYKQDELIVAMGPIVNLAIWAICGLLAQWVYSRALLDPEAARFGIMVFPWLLFTGGLNLLLFLFNMVPVQPLDGGKLLLLGLRRFLPPATALRYAGAVGLVFCLLWWPGLILLFLNTGWLIFFAPSFALHRAMMRGQPRG